MILKTPITLAEPLGGTLTHVVARLVSDNQDEWVSPFGNLRVKGCSHLTAAYRSVPRPSSPVCAKASTNCPYLTLESPHHQHQRRHSAKSGAVPADLSRRHALTCHPSGPARCGMIHISAKLCGIHQGVAPTNAFLTSEPTLIRR